MRYGDKVPPTDFSFHRTMDEVSLGAATMVGELKDGEVREYEIHPEDFGLHMAPPRLIAR